MRNVSRAIAFLALGALALLLLLELLLRLLPVSAGLNPAPETRIRPLYNYEAHRPYRYSYTWAMLNAHRGMTNNYGHISPQDFQAGSRPLIVVGDSFVESLMNDYGDTLQGILGARLGPAHPVYGLGVSGMSASDYVVLAGQARAEFRPAAAVFLITDGDISESLLPRHGGYFLHSRGSVMNLEHVPLTPDPVMTWVRAHVGEPALYRYLRGNLKFSPGDIAHAFNWGGTAVAAQRLTKRASDDERRVADWFLSELPRGSGIAPRCAVLLIDADRYAIYDPRLASRPKDSPELRSYFIDRAHALGFKVVDMGPLFRADYAQMRLKFDYWPTDRHWSRVGHELAAGEVMKALFARSEDGACMPGNAAAAS